MAISDECLRNADECQREAGICGNGSSRDTLLETAALWRRIAATAKLEEAIWHPIAQASALKGKDLR